jgi:uncharacterized membrane protein YhhN
MTNFFLWLTFLFAIIEWIAIVKGWRKLEYLFKPATLVSLIAWVWQNSHFQGGASWFAFGLIFSLFGDVLLVLPREKFIAGLISFLIAHIVYIIGFMQAPPQDFNFAGIISTAIVAFFFAIIYPRLRSGVANKKQSTYQWAVLIYSIVISLMVIAAFQTFGRSEWNITHSAMVSIGALLFYISDITLAWNKFIKRYTYGRLLVMTTYHLGQIALAYGAVMHFIGG